MNILYITYGDPRNAVCGMQQRTNNLYHALQECGNVYVIDVSGKILPDDGGRIVSVLPLRRKGLLGLGAWLSDILNRVTGLYLQWVLSYHLSPLSLDLDKCFPGVKIDIVVARYLPCATIFHAWKVAPLLVDMDDDPLQVFETLLAPSLSPVRRVFARAYLHLIHRWAIGHAQCLWYANTLQAQEKSRSLRCKVLGLPNLPPPIKDGYRYDGKRCPCLMTAAALSYAPNPRGIDRFLHEIWPDVHKRHPDLRYLVAGRGLSAEYRSKWISTPGVEVLGFVEDLDAVYETILATVVPIDQGGGTCIKTLDSLAHARVCLSTEFGCRGIPTSDLYRGANGVCVYDGAKTFIEFLESNVLDKSHRLELESTAKQYIVRNYSFNSFSGIVREGLGL